MVDIWMIITMMFPFSVVTLYSVLECIKKCDQNTPKPLMATKKGYNSKRIINFVTFMLNYGLPFLVTVFIIIFWVLGIINTVAASTEFESAC